MKANAARTASRSATCAAFVALGLALAQVLATGGDTALAQAIGRPYEIPVIRPPPPLPNPNPGPGNDLGGSLRGTFDNLPKTPDFSTQQPPAGLPAAPPAAPHTTAAEPARQVIFRCELASYDETCRNPGAPDGGGSDDECNCGSDRCYFTDGGIRMCEKLN